MTGIEVKDSARLPVDYMVEKESGFGNSESARNEHIAVLIPCFNEALTIGKVVDDFKKCLPGAAIYVYDNNSTDETADVARRAGAIVRFENRQGKGFVVSSMFTNIQAEIYIMVDGDDTYSAEQVHSLLRPIREGRADMVVGNRLSDYGHGAFRSFHVFGNRLVVKTVNWIFRSHLNDIMSGFRAFGQRFVREIPIISRGFEIETEMTLQALYRDFVIIEVPVSYGARPHGSYSKLRTYRDGFNVILKIVDIFKSYRPLLFFGLISIILAAIGLALGSLPIIGFLQTGRVERFPTAILATGLVILSMLSAICGVILDGINHRIKELCQLVIKSHLKGDL
jgi:glycosyltransferase involved in cell wall biosynthesis